jgi:hypothetical protein
MPRLPIDDKTYAKNRKEQYEALGRFVEAFELMVNETRDLCIDNIRRAVLTITTVKYGDKEWDAFLTEFLKRQRLLEISFHHQGMTAKPLMDILRAIVAEIINDQASLYYAERTVFKKVLAHIDEEYSALYWKRNELLHGTWFMGYPDPNDPNASRFDVRKYKTTAEGLKRAELPKNAAELRNLASRCDDTRTWLGHVDFCLRGEGSITDFFKLDGKEWKFFPTPRSSGSTLPKR